MPVPSQSQIVLPKLSYFPPCRTKLWQFLCGRNCERVSLLQPEQEAPVLSKGLCEDLLCHVITMWSPEAWFWVYFWRISFYSVVFCFITYNSRLRVQIPGRRGIQQPNPSKPNSSEGGPKLLCDAAIHHGPWLVPWGKQLQPNSLRVPFFSKLCHSRGGEFAWDMLVQERESLLQLVLGTKPLRTREQVTWTAVQCLVLLGRKRDGWV